TRSFQTRSGAGVRRTALRESVGRRPGPRARMQLRARIPKTDSRAAAAARASSRGPQASGRPMRARRIARDSWYPYLSAEERRTIRDLCVTLTATKAIAHPGLSKAASLRTLSKWLMSLDLPLQ